MVTRHAEPPHDTLASGLLGTAHRAAACVHLERTVAAQPRDVWAALTDPERVRCWLQRVDSGAIEPGGTFVLPLTGDETVACTVLGWNEPYELLLRWDYPGEGPSRLRLRIAEADGGARLTLDHDQIPTDPVDYAASWHVLLGYLADHLVGIDRAAGTCMASEFDTRVRELSRRYNEAAVD